MENYDHIELTEEEQKHALREARKNKHFRLQTEAYWDRVKAGPQLTLPTRSEYRDYMLQKLGPGFTLDEENVKIFDLLAMYAVGDVEFEKEGRSLSKGLFLLGPVGCGKTTLMKALSWNPQNPFVLKHCMQVTRDFTDNGPVAISSNSSRISVEPMRYFGNETVGVCFDDLGTEDTARHFGNRENVMAAIIQARYLNDTLRGKTHFTANISGDEVEQYYGTRARSRLREMCNVLSFDPKAKDRRV